MRAHIASMSPISSAALPIQRAHIACLSKYAGPVECDHDQKLPILILKCLKNR